MLDEQNWYKGEVKDDITIEDLEKMCLFLRLEQDHVRQAEADLKLEKAQLNAMKEFFLAQLEAAGKEKYVSEQGTFYTRNEFSVQTPKTEEQKKAFFNWCKEQDIFWQYASVNSRSLQTLYKSKSEELGETFEMPGVLPAKTYKKLGITSK
jgi:hypothetical protein